MPLVCNFRGESGILDLQIPFNMTWIVIAIIGIIILKVVTEIQPNKKRKRVQKKSVPKKKADATYKNRSSRRVRTDDDLLRSKIAELNGFEFERLMALYFRDKGYVVEEVGGGGSDGGVDLVLKDREGGKTAVQLKCYNDGNTVGVRTVRELVGAKRNYGCLYSLLITSSDLTRQAATEAHDLKVEYWHGSILRDRLKAWRRWQGS